MKWVLYKPLCSQGGSLGQALSMETISPPKGQKLVLMAEKNTYSFYDSMGLLVSLLLWTGLCGPTGHSHVSEELVWYHWCDGDQLTTCGSPLSKLA